MYWRPNIETFTKYNVKKIVTICPHCYNIFKNEYPDLGGQYEVINYTQFLQKLMADGMLKLNSDVLKDKKITFHDPCYLGRANGEYESPRNILKAIPSHKIEMKRNKSFSLCCGGGGGQMFKEAEPGNKEIFLERTEEALKTGADIIATACPFCMVMLTDGIKYKNKEEEVFNYDIAELVVMALDI